MSGCESGENSGQTLKYTLFLAREYIFLGTKDLGRNRKNI